MKRIFSMLAFAAFALSVLAQSPDLMTYQAILRDAGNELLRNQAVAVQISIIQGTPGGTVVYSEVHSESTNVNGLVSLEIGNGVSGDDFSLINWSSGPFFIKTETDPAGGTNYTITSTSQLLSVPYAKYADEAGNVFSGNYADLSGAPINVSAFVNDAGYLTSQLWSLNGTDIYYQGGNVGIGTNSPGELLTLNNGANNTYVSFQNNSTGSGASNGLLMGLRFDSNAALWNYEPGYIHIGTDNASRIMIESGGDVGINTFDPTAQFQVVGDTKFGTDGVAFNELREITGVTGTGNSTQISLPGGYDEDNTRVLCVEIQYGDGAWAGLGSHYKNPPAAPPNLYNVSYQLSGSTIYINYPDDPDYHSKAFRVLIMQIAP